MKRHGYAPKQDKIAINGIVNRTLLSEVTNRTIQDRAPAEYLALTNVFPSGATDVLMRPHFLSGESRTAMEQATATLDDASARRIYDQFQRVRETAIIMEIRKVCGVGAPV